MTTAEATEVLNAHRHHGHAGWYVSGPPGHETVLGDDQYEFFEPFEAVAIAEKYAKGHAPCPKCGAPSSVGVSMSWLGHRRWCDCPACGAVETDFRGGVKAEPAPVKA